MKSIHTHQKQISPRWPLILPCLLLLFILGTAYPATTHAQNDGSTAKPEEPGEVISSENIENWQERKTAHFHILYATGSEHHADYYATFADDVYNDITTIFDHRIETPITMRLYPSQESYAKVNPLAPNLPGIVAHADFRHREVAVVLPATERQTPQEVQNNIRHELTHIVATDLSDNRLNTGFQEGTAQYVEEHVPGLDQKINFLAQLVEQQQLLPWSDLNDRETVYANPKITYPQTLSMAAFLIERYGFAKYRDFLTTTAESSGYRSALQQTYRTSPSELESAWREWLPSYLDGGYRHSVLTSYDLSGARQLLDLGRYAEAQTELEEAITWLQANQEQQTFSDESYEETLAKAEKLLEQSLYGQQAEQLATDARTALQQANYEQAAQLIAEAQEIYNSLGDTRQNDILARYTDIIERGEQAQGELARALRLARALQFPQARTAADTAANEFAVLGDTSRLDQALALRRSLDSRQYLGGLALVSIGIIGIAFSLWSRWTMREEEVW